MEESGRSTKGAGDTGASFKRQVGVPHMDKVGAGFPGRRKKNCLFEGTKA